MLLLFEDETMVMGVAAASAGRAFGLRDRFDACGLRDFDELRFDPSVEWFFKHAVFGRFLENGCKFAGLLFHYFRACETGFGLRCCGEINGASGGCKAGICVRQGRQRDFLAYQPAGAGCGVIGSNRIGCTTAPIISAGNNSRRFCLRI